jgi:hypothetical protein
MAQRRQKGAKMSVSTAIEPEGKIEAPAQATAAVAPTGYRVSISQGALEISARLAKPDELQFLIKILQAQATIMIEATKKEAA